MKIIFLDIDGVLNNESCWGGRPLATNFAQECIEVLNKITEATNACIVVSSSRRILYDINELASILRSAGVKGRILGATPSVRGCRGDEIAMCLDNADMYTNEKITSFVILDDDSDMGNLIEYLIKCNPETGLTEKEAEKAINKLGV